MKKCDVDALFGLCGFVVGLIGIGYAVGCRKRMNDICEKIDRTIEDLSEDVEVDLPESIVNAAVNKAVEKEVSREVNNAIRDIVRATKYELQTEVKSAVKAQYSDMKEQLKTEIKRQVGSIDISDLKKEVVEEAKVEAADRLNGSLDEILEKFNNDLGNISKIYQSIAQSVSKSTENTLSLRLS